VSVSDNRRHRAYLCTHLEPSVGSNRGSQAAGFDPESSACHGPWSMEDGLERRAAQSDWTEGAQQVHKL